MHEENVMIRLLLLFSFPSDKHNYRENHNIRSNN